jgi:tetratricopeptide (TPR) repeat protein
VGQLKDSERPARVGLVVLSIVIIASALLIGALHTVVLASMAALAAIAAATTWFWAAPQRLRRPATILVVLAIALIAFTAFQLIPLPHAWLARLSPHAADLWSTALSPLGEGKQTAAPLSLDPPATAIAVVRGLTYLLVFVASVRLSARRTTASWIMVVIAGASLVVALSSVAHPAFGAHKVFGYYAPNFGVAERHLSPFLNPNHLAEYINIGLCAALGLAFGDEQRLPRIIPVTAAVVLGGVQIWVASRGGVAAMIVGIALVLWLSRQRQGETETRFLLPLAICVMAAVVIGLADSEAREELINADASKLTLLRRTLGMSRDFALFGCGRGAFESVFAAYRPGTGYFVFTHPENILAQWVDEWGWPVGAMGLATLAFALRPQVLSTRRSVACGAWAALVVTGVHNLVDFGSEVPGIMIALAACAGVVTGGAAASETASRVWSARPRLVAGLAGIAGVIAVFVAITAMGRELRDDRKMASTVAVDKSLADADFRKAMSDALLRHPSEPYLPYAGALRAVVVRDESIMPWAERTLRLSPIHGPLHFLLARSLARRSPSQARLELRLAVEQDGTQRRVAIPEGAKLVEGYDDALELAGSNDADSLDAIAKAIELRLPATSARIEVLLHALRPASVTPIAANARALVTDVETTDESAPWCRDDLVRCRADAVAAANVWVGLDPRDEEARAVSARTKLAPGHHEALDELLAACDDVDKRIACLERVVQLSFAQNDSVRATSAMARIQRGGCNSDTECQSADVFLGEIEASRGNSASALAHYKRALDRKPEDEALTVRCAELASRAGLHAEAKQLYERLAARDPAKAEWHEAVSRETRALLTDARLVPASAASR